MPDQGIYHPQASALFDSYEDFFRWYGTREHFRPENPWIGIMLFKSSLIEGQVEAYDYIIERFEDEGFNVLPAFGRPQGVLNDLLLDHKRKPLVDILLAFTLKFYSSLNESVQKALVDLDVPVVNAINLYSLTIDEWREDPVGIPPLDVVWNIANPEISGMIEPTPLTGKIKFHDLGTGKIVYMPKPIKENIRRLIPRIKMWVRLKRKPNAEKRVAILYYNHHQGKQNVGASYLNVFHSLELIFDRMQREGYQIGSTGGLDEEAIKELVLKSGRNIGSWAPGELDKMLADGKLVRVPVAEYKKWFDQQPEVFKSKVLAQWGPVEESKIMIKDGEIIIPAIELDHVAIMPEPSRGWGDEAMKLYHDPTLYPHHQYIAAYLWLGYGFKADAMVHLGTHATYEWLPGKQAGLAPPDPPEIKLIDIPNIYPYIVDDVGEGIQAKRRGRGVIIDHMIPAVKRGGLYHEYAKLSDMIGRYEQSVAQGSKTPEVKLEQIKELVRQTGIDKDMHKTGGHDHQQNAPHEGTEARHQDQDLVVDDEFLEDLEHYLMEMKSAFMPYGLHTFGVSPEGQGLGDTVKAILDSNPEADENAVRQNLVNSGPREIDHFIKALNVGYIPPGEGNDPIRNPAAIPTGKDFYGFSPAQIPSRSAWELGKRAAQQMIDQSLREKGRYPEKVAIVLWATETIRNEGINESTLLYLLGLEPTWDPNGRVTGTAVIPGSQLQRPRIDVLINPSGLYRDLFPSLLLYIDNAIQKAGVLTDVENLLRRHNQEMKTRLVKEGMDPAAADKLSKIRIFTEKPGTYGTGVSEMAGNSGFWEVDDDIVKVYQNRVGYGFGQGEWGIDAQDVFKKNLKDVDSAVHSVSSNLYGVMDNDDMFQYLGGLSLAIRKESGATPDTLVTRQQAKDQVDVEDVAKTVGRELRTRYLNPEWIEGMKKEDYAGANAMSKFVEYMWGWQVTVPTSVDAAKWEQTYDVYVNDKYGLDIQDFFAQASPWAYQSITGRMLESIRKSYWQADDQIKKKLSVEYAMSVIDKGIACCDHTCNNPFLNQMVVNVISLPGVMSPELVEQFKMAVEKAAGKKLAEQVQARKDLQQQLQAGFERKSRETQPPEQQQQGEKQPAKAQEMLDSKTVEGYKMEEIKPQEETTDLSSSGVQWFASLFIVALIAFFVWGVKKGGRD